MYDADVVVVLADGDGAHVAIVADVGANGGGGSS